MKILVTGAAGMLGTDLVRAARAAGHDVDACARAHLDVTDEEAARTRIAGADAVVNCAAWTDVDGAEVDPERAARINGDGARNVASGPRIVQISTDYVFDGTKEGPYVESDPPGPLSAYGKSKLAGELAVMANPRHQIVRTSWLFGTGGRNFVETMLGLDEPRVVDDQRGCPTYTGHLAEAIVELLGTEAWGIHHVAGGGETTWYGFAREIGTHAIPCTTEEFPRPAPRPANSVLRSERDDTPCLPGWQEGLAAYLAERKVAA